MAHPLDGAHAKLGWAEKHFETLGTQWQAFVDTDPYGLHLHRDLDARTIWVYFRVLKPIPEEIALIAGDVVQNLRASLDYVASELVDARGGDPLRAQFPIYVTERPFIHDVRFRKKTRRRGPLNSIPATSDEWAYIERLQPYQRGNLRQAKTDPLYALAYLSNRDKHRALTPAFGAPLINLLSDLFVIQSSRPLKYRWRYLWFPGHALEHRALLGGVDFSITPDQDTVKMDAKEPLFFDVFLDEGTERSHPPQPYGLRRLIEYVRKIVRDAEVFFV